MLEIFKFLKKKEWMFIFVSLVFIVAQVWLDLKLPDYMSTVTRLIQTEGSEMSEILANGGYMMLCALGSMVAAMIVGYFAAKVAAGLAKTLRETVFKKTISFSMEEMNGFSTSSLITRTTNDITQIQTVVAMGLQAIIKAPILAVWAITKIAGKNWEWTAATGAAVVILLILFSTIILTAIPKFKIVQKLTDNLNSVTRENLIGIRVVRAYNAESYQHNKFEKANEDLTHTNLFVNRALALMMPSITLIMSGISLAIYWIGAYLIDSAEMSDKLTLFSDMVVFSSYSVQIIMAFMLLCMIFILLPRAVVSASRIMEVINTKNKIIDGNKNEGKLAKKGTIEFNNVSFKYGDSKDDMLHNISFKVNKGETVAIIGSTGSGKTTLVNMIPRFYDVTKGEVLVDGVNVKEYKQKNLRKKIGYVSQKAILFSGTVSSNVSYGDAGVKENDKGGIKKAVAIAQGTEFVEKMADGYNAAIAQGGSNVSGGQKQRISIARAIARKPDIYIFDDSFSALDYKTDRVLRSALKKEIKGATMLIVAQRIGTIKEADKIIVMSDGKIAGMGTHDELMNNCTTYQEIAYSQLSEEELKNA